MQYLKVMFKGLRSGLVIVIEDLLIRPLMKLAMMLDGSKYLRMTVYNDDYWARMPLPFEVINNDTCNESTRRDMELSRKTHREF